MSSVIGSIEMSFKELVAEKPYRSITVKEICERAFISRRTFYANFVDKRAIVAYLFRRDALDPVARAFELLGSDEVDEVASIVFLRFFQGVRDQGTYYTNLVKPMAGNDPTFELVVARSICKVISRFVEARNPSVDAEQLEAVAYYHAAGCAISLEKWICDGYDKQPEMLGELQASLFVASLKPLVTSGTL